MYDSITPEQWVIGLVVSLVTFAGLVWLLWHYFPARDMSTSDDAPAAPPRSANQSVDQSGATSLRVQTSLIASPGLEPSADRTIPDMDAEQTSWEAPRVSPYLNDTEFIVFLATQKLPNGKYRLSANDIVKTAKGDRTEVLAIVRQVREGAPAFRPLSPEQQQLRADLQLDQVKR